MSRSSGAGSGSRAGTSPACAPEQRGIGFVYQAYHLFPHHTVRANIAYGLKGATADQRRVEELAALLGIDTRCSTAACGD